MSLRPWVVRLEYEVVVVVDEAGLNRDQAERLAKRTASDVVRRGDETPEDEDAYRLHEAALCAAPGNSIPWGESDPSDPNRTVDGWIAVEGAGARLAAARAEDERWQRRLFPEGEDSMNALTPLARDQWPALPEPYSWTETVAGWPIVVAQRGRCFACASRPPRMCEECHEDVVGHATDALEAEVAALRAQVERLHGEREHAHELAEWVIEDAQGGAAVRTSTLSRAHTVLSSTGGVTPGAAQDVPAAPERPASDDEGEVFHPPVRVPAAALDRFLGRVEAALDRFHAPEPETPASVLAGALALPSDERRLRLILPPEMNDGDHWSPFDPPTSADKAAQRALIDAFICWWEGCEHEEGDEIVIRLRGMTDAEVEALPGL